MTKINVENAAIFADHDVIRIPIPNTENESGDAITGTRMSKRFYRLLVSKTKEEV